MKQNTKSHDRLLAERQAFQSTLFAEGQRDGAEYASFAFYRDLKMIESYDLSNLGQDPDAVSLACFLHDTDREDDDTREWLKENLSEAWADSTSYVEGFIKGVRDVVDEIDSLPDPKN